MIEMIKLDIMAGLFISELSLGVDTGRSFMLSRSLTLGPLASRQAYGAHSEGVVDLRPTI